jgi:imidazoleglycerol-phosphate dehydratase
MKDRVAVIERKTKEVTVQGRLNLDGDGHGKMEIPQIPFLKHMLELVARHGLFDLELRATGDVEVDLHHTNEDLGLALGEAFQRALGDKRGIRRFGAYVPMDESLARVVVDVSGRPSSHWGWQAARPPKAVQGGAYTLADARHFLEAFAMKSGLTLHVDILKAGEDIHHVLEAVFKAFGRALREAVERDPRVRGVPSTKGRL